MNDPLKIMDEIERDSQSFPDLKPINAKIAREVQWQAIRTAIEEQIERERELVEAAYREGHLVGRSSGSTMYEDEDWKESKARKALTAHEQEKDDD